MAKENSIRLRHILEAIGRIEEYLNGFDEERFERERLYQDAVLRQLEIIGEASKNISDDLKSANPHIEWRKMAGTRDPLAHGYFSVDIEIVWRITQDFLPKLRSEVEKILEEVE